VTGTRCRLPGSSPQGFGAVSHLRVAVSLNIYCSVVYVDLRDCRFHRQFPEASDSSPAAASLLGLTFPMPFMKRVTSPSSF
jgi:hypothetical protein